MLSLAFCVLLGEGVVGVLGLNKQFVAQVPQQELKSVIEFDSVLESRYKPHQETRIHSQFNEFKIDYHFNELGLRDSSLVQDPAKEKILVLGNSFVEGWGVNQSDSFLSVAQQQLNRKNAPQQPLFRLINAGVSGYGAAQGYLLAKQLLNTIHPTHVYFFYLSTMVQADYRFLQHAQKDKAQIAQGVDMQALLNSNNPSDQEQSKQLKHNAWLKPLLSHSQLLQLIYTRLSNYQAQQNIKAGQPQSDLLAGLRASQNQLPNLHRPSLDHLIALSKLCKYFHIPFTVVLLPMPHQLSAYEWSKGRKAYHLKDTIYPNHDQKLVTQYLSTQDIQVLNADSALKPYVAQQANDENRIYYDFDFHLNKKGHQVLGEWLAHQITNKQ